MERQARGRTSVPATIVFGLAATLSAAEIGCYYLGTSDHRYRPGIPLLLWCVFLVTGVLSLRGNKVAWAACCVAVALDLGNADAWPPQFLDKVVLTIPKLVFLIVSFRSIFRSPRSVS